MKKLLLTIALLLNAACVFAQSSVSGSLTASTPITACPTNACVQIALNNSAPSTLVSVSGTWSATAQFESSIDAGATWQSIGATPWSPSAQVQSTTSNGGWVINTAGKTTFRVRASAYSSGTLAVYILPSIFQAQANTSATIDATGLATGNAQGASSSGLLGTVVEGNVTTSSPSYTNGQSSPVSLDTSGSLRVSVVSGSTGNAASSNTGAAVPTQAGYTGANEGGNLVGVTSSNPSGSIHAIDTVVRGSLPAGSAVIGHTINDSGSTTAVTGNVTVVQPTGSNLQVAVASGTITAVTAITNPLPAGTNVLGHVITDSTSTTVATSATASNFKAQVTGAGSAGTSDTGVQTFQGIAGGTAANVTLSGTNDIRNVTGTVSLPTGAATAAKQAALGIAGTPSVDVYTMQGAAGMTAVSVQSNGANLATETSLAKIPVAQGSTTSGQSGELMQGAVTTAAPSYTTAQTSPLSLDASGSLRVSVVSGSTGNAAASATGSAVPAQADYQGVNVAGTQRGQTGVNPTGTVYAAQIDLTSLNGTSLSSTVPVSGTVSANATLQAGSAQIGHLEANQSVNEAQINGVTPLMGNGASGTGAQRVTIANDSTGQVALAAGSALVGNVGVAQGSTTSGQSGPLIQAAVTTNPPTDTNAQTAPLNMTTAGLLRVQAGAGTALMGETVPVATATTTDTTLPCYITSAASTNATNCKSSGGNLYSVTSVNTTATIYYLRLYNLGASPTCSSATGFVLTIPVPASTSGAGFTIPIPPGLGFSSGIGFCLTGGGSSTDNTSAATGVYLTLLYK